MELLPIQAGKCILTLAISLVRQCILVALLLFSSLSIAVEVEELYVTEADGEYRLRIIEVLEAPSGYVYGVITDYKRAYRINPTITEVEILPSSDDAVIRVRNHSEHWVGPFCFKIDWVGDITEVQEGHIKVVTVPGQYADPRHDFIILVVTINQ